MSRNCEIKYQNAKSETSCESCTIGLNAVPQSTHNEDDYLKRPRAEASTDVNAAKNPQNHASHGGPEGQNSGPSANVENEVAGKELQESLTTAVRRWRGQQVQPHILDEIHATVDHFYTSKSTNEHLERESTHVNPMGPKGELSR